MVHQQARHGLVVAVGQAFVEHTLSLVEVDVAGEQPAVAASGDPAVGRIVFVGDLADQFLYTLSLHDALPI